MDLVLALVCVVLVGVAVFCWLEWLGVGMMHDSRRNSNGDSHH
jgi:hypothetical protein